MAIFQYLKDPESGRLQPSKMLRRSDIIIASLKKELLTLLLISEKRAK